MQGHSSQGNLSFLSKEDKFNVMKYQNFFRESEDKNKFSNLKEKKLNLNPINLNTRDDVIPENFSQMFYPIDEKLFRVYQFNIIKSCLLENTLVCLPTGMGKTFIASIIIFNFNLWFHGKIFFFAPTKPLVNQQKAGFTRMFEHLANQVCEITGSLSNNKRKEFYSHKKIFFMTPQTFENDLKKMYLNSNQISLLIFDEAHKAQKKYAYANIINIIENYLSNPFYQKTFHKTTYVNNKVNDNNEINHQTSFKVDKNNFDNHLTKIKPNSYRIIALSASPGSNMQNIQSLIENLKIKKIELRTEHDVDLKDYIFNKAIDLIEVDSSDDIKAFLDLLIKLINKKLEVMKKYKVIPNSESAKYLGTCHLLKYLNEFKIKKEEYANEIGPDMCKEIHVNFTLIFKLLNSKKLLLTQGLESFRESIRKFEILESHPSKAINYNNFNSPNKTNLLLKNKNNSFGKALGNFSYNFYNSNCYSKNYTFGANKFTHYYNSLNSKKSFILNNSAARKALLETEEFKQLKNKLFGENLNDVNNKVANNIDYVNLANNTFSLKDKNDIYIEIEVENRDYLENPFYNLYNNYRDQFNSFKKSYYNNSESFEEESSHFPSELKSGQNNSFEKQFSLNGEIHPKLRKLESILLDNINNFSKGSKAIIFTEYINSADEIKAYLEKNAHFSKNDINFGLIKGQRKGYNQQSQSEVLQNFKDGITKILISTCVAEEGFDIQDVDLIICYDIMTTSPIKIIQRFGRTGRKKDGRVIVLCSKGEEKSKFFRSIKRMKIIQKDLKALKFEFEASHIKLYENYKNILYVDPEIIKTCSYFQLEQSIMEKSEEDFLSDASEESGKNNSFEYNGEIKTFDDEIFKSQDIDKTQQNNADFSIFDENVNFQNINIDKDILDQSNNDFKNNNFTSDNKLSYKNNYLALSTPDFNTKDQNQKDVVQEDNKDKKNLENVIPTNFFDDNCIKKNYPLISENKCIQIIKNNDNSEHLLKNIPAASKIVESEKQKSEPNDFKTQNKLFINEKLKYNNYHHCLTNNFKSLNTKPIIKFKIFKRKSEDGKKYLTTKDLEEESRKDATNNPLDSFKNTCSNHDFEDKNFFQDHFDVHLKNENGNTLSNDNLPLSSHFFPKNQVSDSDKRRAPAYDSSSHINNFLNISSNEKKQFSNNQANLNSFFKNKKNTTSLNSSLALDSNCNIKMKNNNFNKVQISHRDFKRDNLVLKNFPQKISEKNKDEEPYDLNIRISLNQESLEIPVQTPFANVPDQELYDIVNRAIKEEETDQKILALVKEKEVHKTQLFEENDEHNYDLKLALSSKASDFIINKHLLADTKNTTLPEKEEDDDIIFIDLTNLEENIHENKNDETRVKNKIGPGAQKETRKSGEKSKTMSDSSLISLIKKNLTFFSMKKSSIDYSTSINKSNKKLKLQNNSRNSDESIINLIEENQLFFSDIDITKIKIENTTRNSLGNQNDLKIISDDSIAELINKNKSFFEISRSLIYEKREKSGKHHDKLIHKTDPDPNIIYKSNEDEKFLNHHKISNELESYKLQESFNDKTNKMKQHLDQLINFKEENFLSEKDMGFPNSNIKLKNMMSSNISNDKNIIFNFNDESNKENVDSNSLTTDLGKTEKNKSYQSINNNRNSTNFKNNKFEINSNDDNFHLSNITEKSQEVLYYSTNIMNSSNTKQTTIKNYFGVSENVRNHYIKNPENTTFSTSKQNREQFSNFSKNNNNSLGNNSNLINNIDNNTENSDDIPNLQMANYTRIKNINKNLKDMIFFHSNLNIFKENNFTTTGFNKENITSENNSNMPQTIINKEMALSSSNSNEEINHKKDENKKYTSKKLTHPYDIVFEKNIVEKYPVCSKRKHSDMLSSMKKIESCEANSKRVEHFFPIKKFKQANI